MFPKEKPAWRGRHQAGLSLVEAPGGRASIIILPVKYSVPSLVWRYSSSYRGMDRKSGHGSMRLGTGSPLLIRDRDGAYGEVFIRRLRSIGIRDRPTSPRSPWQNGYAERLIGSIRRECLDHVVVFGERHLRHVLLSYITSVRLIVEQLQLVS